MDASSLPASLVLHDGELGDVCALLGELALRFRERRNGARPEDRYDRWDLVIATPRRMLEFRGDAAGSDPTRIAVLDRDSTTLRAMLRRAGIDLVVRRPVHPAALRLLLLHSLYRGPERRRSPRVSVGAAIRYRMGLRRRDCILADLSLAGCRLLSPTDVEAGRKISLHLPAVLTGGRGFQVDGSIVRTGPSELDGVTSIAVSFGTPSRRTATRLEEAVRLHSEGPAVLAVEGLAAAGPEPGPAPSEGPAAEDEDRRTSRRREYVQHVIALGAEAGRVLMGRDMSMGGMRVDPHPDLRLGDRLRIGLHLRAREKPLVVTAFVSRDDGAAGLGLAFDALPPGAARTLRGMVDALPILAVHEGDEGKGLVPTEILEHGASPLGEESTGGESPLGEEATLD